MIHVSLLFADRQLSKPRASGDDPVVGAVLDMVCV